MGKISRKAITLGALNTKKQLGATLVTSGFSGTADLSSSIVCVGDGAVVVVAVGYAFAIVQKGQDSAYSDW
jgi:hypothetical protein